MLGENSLRLVIAEDHRNLRTALNIFFSVQPDIEVIGEAANTEQALPLCQQLQPDVILVNSELRPMDILEFISQLCAESPHARIIVLSSVLNPIPFAEYLEAGADDAVDEGIGSSKLLAIIQQQQVS
jgi:DNA-binding NarL/FixJ family response regulator